MDMLQMYVEIWLRITVFLLLGGLILLAALRFLEYKTLLILIQSMGV